MAARCRHRAAVVLKRLGKRWWTIPYVTLLVAMDHAGRVLAQSQVADKSNEIPAFQPLLDSRPDRHGQPRPVRPRPLPALARDHALGHRKSPAPRPRPHLPRGRLQDPRRPSPAHPGRPAQSRPRRPPSASPD